MECPKLYNSMFVCSSLLKIYKTVVYDCEVLTKLRFSEQVLEC